MIITITDECAALDDGSVIVLTGTDEGGHAITFAADRRPAADLLAAAQELGELQVEVEDWQILGRF